jgi:hypothetical protein
LGVFANALTVAVNGRGFGSADPIRSRGIVRWFIEHVQKRTKAQSRLTVIERVTVAPRQSLLLVEADGQRVLVATSPDGTPAIFPLDSTRTRGRLRKTLAEGKSE